jgi:hypothetical protein
VPWRAIEGAEFTVSYADIRIVKDNVINESDSVTEETIPQHVCYKAHRINIIRFDQPNALFKAKSVACEGTVKDITNIGFTQKIRNQSIIIVMQMLTGSLDPQ